jgi:hypothetical protein
VDALRTTRKRYYYVDGVLRLWVRLHARGVRASEEEILSCARELLAAAAPAPATEGGGGGVPSPGIDGDRLAMIFQSPRPPVDDPRVSVTSFILERASEFAERIALVDAITDRRMTYCGLEATIARAAAGLAARGYGRGGRLRDLLSEHARVSRSPSTARPGWAR